MLLYNNNNNQITLSKNYEKPVNENLLGLNVSIYDRNQFLFHHEYKWKAGSITRI